VDIVRPPQNKIYIANRTDKVIEVWKGLIDHNFWSVPVLQKTKQKWYGFLDLWDIVKFVVEQFKTSNDELLRNSDDWLKLVSAKEEFMNLTVNDVMRYPLSRENPFFPIHAGYSLFAAIEALARQPHLHRVPIIDKERHLVTIITQSQVIKILDKNLNMLGEKKNKPVMKLDNYYERVVSVHEDSVAMDAFRLMVEKDITGVAVIDNEGKLTGTVSIRDLKAISTDTRMFWRLYQTCKNFLLKVKSGETTGDRPRSPVTVKATDTLEIVIKKLNEHNIHRVFIIDDAKRPIGVISLKDILLEIINYSR